METKGHIAGNGGLRGHSVGDVYPYIVFIKGNPNVALTWHVLHPNGVETGPFPDAFLAHEHAALLKLGPTQPQRKAEIPPYMVAPYGADAGLSEVYHRFVGLPWFTQLEVTFGPTHATRMAMDAEKCKSFQKQAKYVSGVVHWAETKYKGDWQYACKCES